MKKNLPPLTRLGIERGWIKMNTKKQARRFKLGRKARIHKPWDYHESELSIRRELDVMCRVWDEDGNRMPVRMPVKKGRAHRKLYNRMYQRMYRRRMKRITKNAEASDRSN